MTLRSHAAEHPGLVHLALAVGGFAIGTTEFAAMSLEPDLARGLGVDAPTVGHVISAYALGVVVGAPTIAVLAAKLPRRLLLVALMMLFAIGNGLSALAPSYGWMLAFRFLAGLPHGAYFGISALVAASLVPAERRTQAVGRVMLGLTVATIVGVPLATWLGQIASWRWVFALVAGLALVTAALVATLAPVEAPDADASPLRELGALSRPQVWLTLATGAIGFGGLFAVYTYLAATLDAVTGVPKSVVPFVLAAFGIGMTLGNLIVPRFADRALMPTAGVLLLWSAACLALYPLAAHSLPLVTLDVFAIGFGGALATVLQTRLMDVAGDAQALAAALNHSAFNIANAIGPWLGGLAIAAGLGWTATGWVGCGLALGGVVVWALALVQARGGLRLPPRAQAVREGG
ncbi:MULTISPECIES: MFS transporter [unclassified Sphingomonas]|jgi:MFS transporter, DHA1 family, inner membrane transport protein|uniref:MFS transporter n=1 Tax=unclassified Sphingomonas TaxID=196159 RepID=UPI000E10DEE9|nr:MULTISPECIES: MFS transporter [unclassified Sphingomonas]AXJ95243.1 MFS transporter [Sphingomonas sp. FARSPH]